LFSWSTTATPWISCHHRDAKDASHGGSMKQKKNEKVVYAIWIRYEL
jgi:hypothetical protein